MSVILFFIGFFLFCMVLSWLYMIMLPIVRMKPAVENFADAPASSSPASASALAQDCSQIPLSAFETQKVMANLTPTVQYAISMYSTGNLNYYKEVNDAFLTGSPEVQMSISALLGRYLAINGGAAAAPGPGYLFTSVPGNYTTQLNGATDLLKPKTIDISAPVYPSFQAAMAVAKCPKQNKGWISTDDFPKTLPLMSDLYEYATPMTGITPGPLIDHNAVN